MPNLDLFKAYQQGLKESQKNNKNILSSSNDCIGDLKYSGFPLDCRYKHSGTTGVEKSGKEFNEYLFSTFSQHYEKLSSLPRKIRRALQKKWKHSLAGIALVLALGGVPAIAAEINVDADCTLIQAINSANDDNAMGNGCEDGSGPDNINLPSNSTQTLTAVDNNDYGPTGLPTVTTNITIEGNGSTIERDSGTPSFRIFNVSTVGNLTLNETSITGGLSDTVTDTYCNLQGYAGTKGGAIYCCECDLTVTNSTITSNNSINDGGGIYSAGSSDINIINSIISNNNTDIQIFNSSDDGGGICMEGPYYSIGVGILNIENSTISGNSSGEGGGIYLVNNTTCTISNSTISGNTVFDNVDNQTPEGGGIYNDGDLTISNSTISGNMSIGTGAEGGGLHNNDGATANLYNVTIFGNSSDDQGGGIYNEGDLNLFNTIVSGNSATTGSEIEVQAGTVTADNNNLFGHSGLNDMQAFVGFSPTVPTDINATSDGTIITLSNIINLTLADNGGPTQTHALPPQSVAVDGGDNTTCADGNTVNNEDQRHFPRPFDGDGANGAECDIGAYELQDTGTISITKMSDPSDTGFGFTSANFPEGCELQSPFTLDDGDTKSCIVPLNPDDDTDDYSVTEDDPSGEGFISTVIDCTETGMATSTDDTNNPSVDLGIVADGDTIDCVFTNQGDNDGDGELNGEDNCPDDANPGQENSDGDSLGDVCDNCPNDTNENQLDFDMDGMGDVCDTDDDNDGVDDTSDSDRMNQQVCSDIDMDTCDDCTNTTASVNQGGNTADDGTDTDADGICDTGDTDDDNDGVEDGSDSDPMNPNECKDDDADTCDDCAVTGADESGGDTNNDGPDADADGMCDAGDEDTGDDDVDSDDIEIDSEGTSDNGVRVAINVGSGVAGGGTILVDLPPQVKPQAANIVPNIGDCEIVDPDSDTNVVDVDIVCDVPNFTSEFDLDLELCLEGGDEDAEGITNAEVEVVANNSEERFSEIIPILLTALEGCGDGGGCSVAPVNTTRTGALSNFLVTLIPAIVGLGAMFFRRRKD